MTRRDELAAFLRARRDALAPADVGLPAGRARRTKGLRREEIAMLAGVSVTWYTWLEQGRPINASVDVLSALARALQLDDAARQHLLALAARESREPIETVEHAPDALVRLITSMEPAPAYVLGPRWEFLAWNRPQSLLYPTDRSPGRRRSQPAVGRVRRAERPAAAGRLAGSGQADHGRIPLRHGRAAPRHEGGRTGRAARRRQPGVRRVVAADSTSPSSRHGCADTPIPAPAAWSSSTSS